MNLGTENEYTEFKEGMAQLDKALVSLSAMLNRHDSGTVYIGVSDDGEVIGIDIGSSTLEDIRNRIRNKLKPRIVADIRAHVSEDGKHYVSIHAEGYDSPYSYDDRYYVRNVSSNESVDPDMLRSMFNSAGNDVLFEMESLSQDLTFQSLFLYMESMNLHPRMDSGFFSSHKMVNRSGKFNETAYLLSDQCDVVIQVVKFEGTSKTNLSGRTDFGHKSLPIAVDAVFEHVKSLQETKVDMSEGFRKNLDLFDFDSFREAWVNACVHNDWKNYMPPSVFVFDDRIEVQSYGQIPFKLSMEKFYTGHSMPVNRSLFEIFEALGLTEQSGYGVPKIVEKYGRSAFDISEGIVKVVIPFAFEPERVNVRKHNRMEGCNLSERQKEILRFLKNNDRAKLQVMATEIGVSLSVVKKEVSELKKAGMLTNEGSSRNTRWIVL